MSRLALSPLRLVSFLQQRTRGASFPLFRPARVLLGAVRHCRWNVRRARCPADQRKLPLEFVSRDFLRTPLHAVQPPASASGFPFTPHAPNIPCKPSMQYREFGSTGMRVSVLGFGGSPLGDVFGETPLEEKIRAVHAAVDAGINYFDTSPFYGLGKAEEVLGKALAGIPRDQYYIGTKVGRYGEHEFDFSAGRVRMSINTSLERLGVTYLDVVLCHDIEFGSIDQVVSETIPTLVELKKEGKIRHIGFSGLPLDIFPKVLSQTNEVDVVLSYCHYALCDETLHDIVPFLQEKNVAIVNASPLSMGLLTQRGPPTWHPAPQELKEACARAAKECADAGVDIADIALSYACAYDKVATTLVGMRTVDEVERNIRAALSVPDTAAVARVKSAIGACAGMTWPSGNPGAR